MPPKRALPDRRSFSGIERFVEGCGVSWDDYIEDEHAEHVEREFTRIMELVSAGAEAAPTHDAEITGSIVEKWLDAGHGGFPTLRASWVNKVKLIDLWYKLQMQHCHAKRDNMYDPDDVDGDVAAEALVAAAASTNIDLSAVPPTPTPPPQPNLDEECDAVLTSLYGEAMVYDGLPKCVFPCHYSPSFLSSLFLHVASLLHIPPHPFFLLHLCTGTSWTN